MRPTANKRTRKKTEHTGAKRKATGARRKAAAGPREYLRRLVDELPEAELGAAGRFLAFLRAGGLTPELEDRLDVALAREALEEMKRTGEKPIPYEKIRRELGL